MDEYLTVNEWIRLRGYLKDLKDKTEENVIKRDIDLILSKIEFRVL